MRALLGRGGRSLGPARLTPAIVRCSATFYRSDPRTYHLGVEHLILQTIQGTRRVSVPPWPDQTAKYGTKEPAN